MRDKDNSSHHHYHHHSVTSPDESESERKLKGRLHSIFDSIDTDKSGYIEEEELQRAFLSLDIHLSKRQVKELVSKLDRNSDSRVDFDEFFHFFSKLKPNQTNSNFNLNGRGNTKKSNESDEQWIGSIDLKLISNTWMHTIAIDIGSDLVPPTLPKNSFTTSTDTTTSTTANGNDTQISTADNMKGSEGNSIFNPTLYTFVIAGGLGGVISRSCTAPLERLKIQQQTDVMPKDLAKSIYKIYYKEGLAGFFRGNLYNCLRVFPFAGFGCLFYSQLVKVLPCDDEFDPYEPFWRCLAGSLAGIGSTVLTYPLDLIRARITINQDATLSSIIKDLTRTKVTNKRSYAGLFKGIVPTIYAVAPFIGFQQASYDALKSAALQYGGFEPSAQLFLVCGASAGLIAQSIVYPMDVYRRKLQVGQNITSLQAVYKMGGISALYAGIGPTFIKVAPAVSISVVVRDWCLGRFTF